MIAPLEVTSKLLALPRKVWVQPAVFGSAPDCLIFLDGELYLERVKAPAIIDDLQKAGRLPPVECVYLSNLDGAARHIDFTCNATYSFFLATDLLRWIEQALGSHERIFLCGLSLSGLSAAFTASRHPGTFSGILSQSPSAWWNDEWLASSLAGCRMNPGRFWISVGNKEIQENISHPPSGLFQKSSQLESVRRLARNLKDCCTEVQLKEFSGGHDPACWANELPTALSWLLQAT